jgi:hypothetical protein
MQFEIATFIPVKMFFFSTLILLLFGRFDYKIFHSNSTLLKRHLQVNDLHFTSPNLFIEGIYDRKSQAWFTSAISVQRNSEKLIPNVSMLHDWGTLSFHEENPCSNEQAKTCNHCCLQKHVNIHEI